MLARSPGLLLSAVCLLSAQASALTEHAGTIGSNETWAGAGEVHLITGEVNVASGVTLTIQPGAIIKFRDRYSLTVADGGILLAAGTASERIYFTSYKDDSVGGDTNGDADASSPAAGDWWRLNFTNGEGCRLIYSEIRYGGYYTYYGNERGAVYLNFSSFVDPAPVVENCTIEHVSTYGIYIEGSSASEPQIISNSFNDCPNWAVYNTSTSLLPNVAQNQFTVPKGVYVRSASPVTDNTFADATSYAIYVYGSGASITGNTTTGNTDYGLYTQNGSGALAALSGNSFGGTGAFPIRIHAEDVRRITANSYSYPNGRGYETLGGQLSTSATWPDFSTWPLVMVYTTLTIPDGVTLTLAEGSVIKFSARTSIQTNGTLLAEGSVDAPIVFTSYKDDTAAGDTNGDGDTSSPASGDWWRLNFSNGAGSRLVHADIRYGGYYTYYGDERGIIYLNFNTTTDPAPVIQDCTIAHASSYGIYIEGSSASEPQIISNSFNDCPNWAVYNTSTSLLPNVAQNQFTVPKGVYVRSASPVTDNTFADATSYAIYVYGSGASITGNTTTGTTNYGLYTQNGSGALGAFSGNSFGGTGAFPVRVHADDIRHLTLNSFDCPAARGYETIGGTLNASTTWPDFSSLPLVMVYSHVTVPSGISLQLTEGSVVKFSARTSFTVSGTLLAEGTAVAPIVFTSYKDDTVAGDTNGDEGSSTPAAGDWWRLNFTNGTGSRLDHTQIRYGGYYTYYGDDRGVIYLNFNELADPAPVIQNSTIEHSSHYGVYVEGSSTSTPLIAANTFSTCPSWAVYNSSTTILPNITGNQFTGPYGVYVRSASPVTNNTFTDATNYAIYIYGTGSTVTGNTTTGDTEWGIYTQSGSIASFVGNSFSGTGDSPVRLNPNDVRWLSSNTFDWPLAKSYRVIGGTIENNATWRSLGVPYVIDGSVTIASGDTLTIDAGVLIKMNRYGWTVNGGLIAAGDPGLPVVFTSIHDDAWGGDTNGNDAATSPNPGDWYHISFPSAGSFGDLRFTNIEYAGYSSGYGLYAHDNDPVFADGVIRKCSTYGAYLDNSAAHFERSSITESPQGVYCRNGSAAVLSNCNIENNSTWGVYNQDSGVEILAENCWWGDASGPYNATANPSGNGDNVSDHVDFSPWRDIEYTANAVVVQLTPFQSIIPRGGTGDFKEVLANTSAEEVSFTHRFRVLDGAGDPFHTFQSTPVTLAAGESRTYLYSMKVPNGVPVGLYTLEAQAFDGPTELDSDSFGVEVIDLAANSPGGNQKSSGAIEKEKDTTDGHGQRLDGDSTRNGGAIEGGQRRGRTARAVTTTSSQGATLYEGDGFMLILNQMESTIFGRIPVAENERVLVSHAGERAGDSAAEDVATDHPELNRGRPPLPEAHFGMAPAAPNPFNPSTRLQFSLEEPGMVQLRIYDAAGHLVRTLVDGEEPAGYHAVRWDGRSDSGSAVPSGVYTALLVAGEKRALQRMLLVK